MRRQAKAPSAGSNLCQASGASAPAPRLLATLSLALLIALAFAASAQAGGRVKSSEFGSAGTAGGQFNNVADLAVNTKGNGGVELGTLYTVDSGNNRIQQLSATGSFIRTWGAGVADGGATGTGTVTNGSTTISSVLTTSKAFAVGQAIEGTGIAPGTTITEVTAGTIKLSQAATAAATGAGTAIAAPLAASNVARNEKQTLTLSPGLGGGTFTLTYTTPNPSNTTATTGALPYNAPASGAGSVQAALEALSNIGAGNVEVSGSAGGPYTVEFKGTRFADTNVAQMTVTPSGLTAAVGSQQSCSTTTTADNTAFKWLSNGEPATGTGANTATYTVAPADAGKALQCQVSESNNANGVGSTQVSTPPILIGSPSGSMPTAPASISITGTVGEGQSLTCPASGFTGTAGATPFTYVWLKNGSTVLATHGPTASNSDTYTLTAGDVASPAVFQCMVIASNANGAVAKVSNNKATVTAPNPAAPGGNTSSPAVSVPSLTASIATTVEGATAFEVCSTASTCRAGFPVGSAGGMSAPQGIAVDPVNGNLFVTDEGNRRVDVFSASGAFEGAFGWGVADNPSPGPQTAALQFCTAACFTGLSGAGVGEFGAKIGHPAIDTSVNPHRLYVASPSNLRVDYFAPTLTANTVTGVSFVKTIGWDVVSSGPDNKAGTVLELCNPAANPTDVCKIGASVVKSGSSPEAGFYNIASSVVPVSVAVAGDGSLLADVQKGGAGSATAESPTRVFKFTFSGTGSSETVERADFAPGSLLAETGTANAVSDFVVTVDQSTGTVMVAKKGGTTTTMKFLEFDPAGNPLSESPHVPLPVNVSAGSRGLAFGIEERLYFADGAGNKVYVLTPPPAPSATISAASNVTTTTAVLHGKVTPPLPVEGEHFATSYNFEYSADGVTWQSTPTLQAGDGSGSIEVSSSCPTGNPQSCDVSQEITGLQSNKGYLVRLRANTGSVATSSTTSFTTGAAAPTVTEPFSAEAATQTSAKILAVVNPNNQPTTYHFEWGETTSYGNEAPPLEAFAGSGGEGVRVAATLSGLTPASTYHFRLVATSPAGTTVGPDRQFETLGHCDLPDDRCYELVSPPDKGPAGVITTLYSTGGFQAGPDDDSVVFPYLNPDEATAGGGLMYLGKRSESGWSSSQLNPPSLVPVSTSTVFGTTFAPGEVLFDSPDLSCSIVASYSPLTDDVPATDTEYALRNLFSRDAAGAYRLITTPVPSSPSVVAYLNGFVAAYRVPGATPDCKRVYFSADYQYLPGNPTGLYESDDGTVRDAGLRPDGSTPPGGHQNTETHKYVASVSANSVSNDGKLYFSTTSDKPATNGKAAVFMRENGGPSVEITEKQGGANDSLGSRFGAASKDGSHVFFVSTYGLTPSSSSGPAEACNSFSAGEAKACDLYDYETETGDLTNLTGDSNGEDTKGAVVQRVLAASEEGGAVYFTAMGQLVPGKGKTYAQNTEAANASERTANVYLAKGGSLKFVTNGRDGLIGSAKTTPEGSYLLFNSTANLTGLEPGGHSQAYLYSSGSGEIQCVSCRRDGQAAVGLFGNQFVGADGTVFFSSRDALASGAAQGNINVYEWKRGQTFLLVAGQGKETSTGQEVLYGASSSGEDVFFGTIVELDPHDVDTVADLYDARVDGGFAPPPTPPTPCDPFADQCQGTAATPPAAPSPTSGASGSGNPPIGTQPKPRCGKNQVRRKGRCVKPRKHKRSAAHKRATNANRGGIK